jgi:predicted DNA-binding transcriptional regulator AlpA
MSNTMSVNEVAAFLGVSRAYVYLLIRDDVLHPLAPPKDSILKQPPKRFERGEVEALREMRLQEKRAG